MKFKKTLLAIVVGLNVIVLTSSAYAASRSGSSGSSRSYSSSKPSYSSSNSSSKPSYSSSSSSSSTYKPVSTSSLSNTPYKPVNSQNSKTKQNVGNKPTKQNQSYSSLKKQQVAKGKKDSNFLTWVLLAWIISDSNKSSASSNTTTKEVLVDCKQWLKDNGHKANDIENLSNKDFVKIKKYCDSIVK